MGRVSDGSGSELLLGATKASGASWAVGYSRGDAVHFRTVSPK